MHRSPRSSLRVVLAVLAGAATALLLVSSLALAADPEGKPLYQQGASQYDDRQYDAAARSFEAAIQAGYRTGDTYYKLGLAYAQLKRYDEALWAYDSARAVDPAIGGQTKIDEKTAEARSKGSGTSRAPAFVAGTSSPPAVSPGLGSDLAAAALRQQVLYVAPGLAGRLSGAAAQRVEQQAAELAGRGHPARFALIDTLPRGFGSLGDYVEALHTDLKLGPGMLIVADGGGVAAKSDRLSRAQMQDLTNRGASTFRLRGYDAGFLELSSAIAQAIEAQQAAGLQTTVVIAVALALLVLAGAAAFLLPRRGRWLAALARAGREREQGDNLVLALERDVPYLPGDAAGQAARQAYAEGLERWARGKERLEPLQRRPAWRAALAAGASGRELAAVRADMAAAGESFQKAAQLGKIDLGDVPAGPAPAGAEPQACFFCGRRLEPGTAEMATFRIGGEERGVVVCPEHAADLQAGRRPRVRGVETEPGRFVPWYTVPYYDPDYDHYHTTDLDWDRYESFSSWQPGSRAVIYQDDHPDDRQFARAAEASFASEHPAAEEHQSGASFSSFEAEPSAGAAETRWDSGGDRS